MKHLIKCYTVGFLRSSGMGENDERNMLRTLRIAIALRQTSQRQRYTRLPQRLIQPL
ncbi:MAG TPA: hypothetical protein V6C85_34490 [Allocoleopsis sp.]